VGFTSKSPRVWDFVATKVFSAGEGGVGAKESDKIS
jgi:hypothetical protein